MQSTTQVTLIDSKIDINEEKNFEKIQKDMTDAETKKDEALIKKLIMQHPLYFFESLKLITFFKTEINPILIDLLLDRPFNEKKNTTFNQANDYGRVKNRFKVLYTNRLNEPLFKLLMKEATETDLARLISQPNSENTKKSILKTLSTQSLLSISEKMPSSEPFAKECCEDPINLEKWVDQNIPLFAQNAEKKQIFSTTLLRHRIRHWLESKEEKDQGKLNQLEKFTILETVIEEEKQTVFSSTKLIRLWKTGNIAIKNKITSLLSNNFDKIKEFILSDDRDLNSIAADILEKNPELLIPMINQPFFNSALAMRIKPQIALLVSRFEKEGKEALNENKRNMLSKLFILPLEEKEMYRITEIIMREKEWLLPILDTLPNNVIQEKIKYIWKMIEGYKYHFSNHLTANHLASLLKTDHPKIREYIFEFIETCETLAKSSPPYTFSYPDARLFLEKHRSYFEEEKGAPVTLLKSFMALPEQKEVKQEKETKTIQQLILSSGVMCLRLEASGYNLLPHKKIILNYFIDSPQTFSTKLILDLCESEDILKLVQSKNKIILKMIFLNLEVRAVNRFIQSDKMNASILLTLVETDNLILDCFKNELLTKYILSENVILEEIIRNKDFLNQLWKNQPAFKQHLLTDPLLLSQALVKLDYEKNPLSQDEIKQLIQVKNSPLINLLKEKKENQEIKMEEKIGLADAISSTRPLVPDFSIIRNYYNKNTISFHYHRDEEKHEISFYSSPLAKEKQKGTSESTMHLNDIIYSIQLPDLLKMIDVNTEENISLLRSSVFMFAAWHLDNLLEEKNTVAGFQYITTITLLLFCQTLFFSGLVDEKIKRASQKLFFSTDQEKEAIFNLFKNTDLSQHLDPDSIFSLAEKDPRLAQTALVLYAARFKTTDELKKLSVLIQVALTHLKEEKKQSPLSTVGVTIAPTIKSSASLIPPILPPGNLNVDTPPKKSDVLSPIIPSAPDAPPAPDAPLAPDAPSAPDAPLAPNAPLAPDAPPAPDAPTPPSSIPTAQPGHMKKKEADGNKKSAQPKKENPTPKKTTSLSMNEEMAIRLKKMEEGKKKNEGKSAPALSTPKVTTVKSSGTLNLLTEIKKGTKLKTLTPEEIKAENKEREKKQKQEGTPKDILTNMVLNRRVHINDEDNSSDDDDTTLEEWKDPDSHARKITSPEKKEDGKKVLKQEEKKESKTAKQTLSSSKEKNETKKATPASATPANTTPSTAATGQINTFRHNLRQVTTNQKKDEGKTVPSSTIKITPQKKDSGRAAPPSATPSNTTPSTAATGQINTSRHNLRPVTTNQKKEESKTVTSTNITPLKKIPPPLSKEGKEALAKKRVEKEAQEKKDKEKKGKDEKKKNEGNAMAIPVSSVPSTLFQPGENKQRTVSSTPGGRAAALTTTARRN